jgi:hypothetical protein
MGNLVILPRENYVRFVVGGADENLYALTGILTIARQLRDEGKLEPFESEYLDEIFAWFNVNLPCPPFSEKRSSGEWTPDAVAWFKDGAVVPINRMWDIVAILREHEVQVRFVQTDAPGKTVYSDEYQVVAETPKHLLR